jgi:hypothetical protein
MSATGSGNSNPGKNNNEKLRFKGGRKPTTDYNNLSKSKKDELKRLKSNTYAKSNLTLGTPKLKSKLSDLKKTEKIEEELYNQTLEDPPTKENVGKKKRLRNNIANTRKAIKKAEEDIKLIEEHDKPDEDNDR